MSTITTNAEAAELLGMKPSEIHSVESSPGGPLIVTTDGTALIVVPDDQPDAEGKTGVMFAVAPTETYSGTFPVYAVGDTPDPEEDRAVREDLHRVREVPPPGVGGPPAERTTEVEPQAPVPANSGVKGAGPSAATAADPAKVEAGDATTHPAPDAAGQPVDPGLHDPAVGGPVDAPSAVPPLAGDGPVGTAVIAEVPAGSSTDVLAWVGTDRGRAKQALAAERAASRPRSRLLAQLEKLAAQPEA